MLCCDNTFKKEKDADTIGKYANLSVISDVKGTKPYSVLYEEPLNLILADTWSKLIEKITENMVATFSDDGGRKLKESKAQDGYGKMYFFEGKQRSVKYAYISTCDLSVYKSGGANLTIEIVKEICNLYAIDLDKVIILYK